MSLGKYLFAGGLGFVLGGPIGAVVGVVLATLLPNTELTSTTTSTKKTNKGDFRVVLLIMFASIMKQDEITVTELTQKMERKVFRRTKLNTPS